MYEESTSQLVAQIYPDNQTQKDKKWFSFSFQTETTLQKSERKMVSRPLRMILHFKKHNFYCD